MSTPKHTPEPWRVDMNESLKVRMIVSSSGEAVGKAPVAQILTTNPYAVPEEVQIANAERIVECVNACAGIDEPAKFIKAVELCAKAVIERNELRNWKAQAQNGFRLMEEAHELLKAEHDQYKSDCNKLLEALEGMILGTTIEFSQINGFGEQRMKASEVYDLVKWGAAKTNKPRTTTDEII